MSISQNLILDLPDMKKAPRHRFIVVCGAVGRWMTSFLPFPRPQPKRVACPRPSSLKSVPLAPVFRDGKLRSQIQGLIPVWGFSKSNRGDGRTSAQMMGCVASRVPNEGACVARWSSILISATAHLLTRSRALPPLIEVPIMLPGK